MQQWYDEEFGPTGTANGGVYADKSYWLCTENWSNQNYPIALSAYYDIGGFSNGGVPMFIVIGFENKVYWDGNSSSFGNALRQAIDEMLTEGVYVDNHIDDEVLLFDSYQDIDVSNVFVDIGGSDVTVTIESNSNPEIVSAEIIGTTLKITTNGATPGTSTIIVKGTAGEFSDTDEFVVSVFDPEFYNVEDFETGDFTLFPWSFSGNADWGIESSYPFEGTYCAKSLSIGSSQKAEMMVEIDYPNSGKIFFNHRVSSEGNYDYLKFYIDGSLKGNWSGTSSWNKAAYDVTPGVHIFKWTYIKDSSGDLGDDCAWVDKIVFEGGASTSISNEQLIIDNYKLYQNYPNPFNPTTEISFSLDVKSHVTLAIYNHTGQLVSELVNEVVNAGMHSTNFDASDLNSGIYFYTLESGNLSLSKKMILIK
ncbi:MAG: T9SS type A sorting domain-containing protein [Candidatus Delongbacteria bacterium]|nr:T9SS type A sorting domain-containing protein [Candidatus Delongbacteria bacterium]